MRLASLALLAASGIRAQDNSDIRALIDAGDRAQAQQVAARRLEAAAGGPERVKALDGLAEAWATGRPADTQRVRELTAEALAIDPSAVEPLTILAAQLSGAGDHKQARELLEQAVAKDPAGFRAQLQLARTLLLGGDLARSRAVFEKTISRMEERFGANSAEVAPALTAFAAMLNTATQYAEARKQLERAVAIQRGSPGPGLAEALTGLAYTAYAQGDDTEARKYAEEAVGLFDANPTRAVAAAARAHRIMSNVLIHLGDYSGARTELEQAATIDEKLFGTGSVEVANDRNGMGLVATDAGDPGTARKLFSEALAIYEQRLGPGNTQVGGALDNLGQAFFKLKDYAEAKRSFERALTIQTKALGPDSPWTANLYQGLAKVAMATGDYKLAQASLEKNLEIWRPQLGPSHAFTLVSLGLLADVLVHLGDRGAAMKTALEAARLHREYLADTVRGVSEQQALQVVARKSTGLDTAIGLASDCDANLVAAWDELIRSRALVLDEMAARYRAARSSGDPAAAELLAAEGRARTELARAAFSGKSAGLAEKRLALRAAERALAEKSEVWQGRLRRESAGFAEVSAALPTDSALVSFVRFGKPDYAAFVMRGGVRKIISLGDAARIEAQVAATGREIARERDAAGHSERRNEESYRAAGEALRRSVWDPLAGVLGGAKRVYVVPDGVLQLVNFGALPVGTQGYLIESGPVLHMLSAERDLLQSAQRGAGEKVLLTLGNPSFGTVPATVRGSGPVCALKFDALPGSGRESAEVASIWKSLGWPVEALSGARATEAFLKGAAPGKEAVHIATHGFFLGDGCLSDNPLLRSGLALSDGVLTAAQAASLNLENADWVVLSGCDTGLGDVRAGEGVLGLRRAFQEAGARTVVASLWPVSDEAVRPWMASVYRYRFVRGLPAAEALRAADRDSLRTRRAGHLSTHPFYWGSFIAVERE
jgi:CHAT domain-containing protein/Tfp pilus assembly protein PilF